VRRHKDGSLVDVNATTSGLFDDDGRFLGHFNIFKDLKSKRDQDLANAFLATIVRASPDAIASTDVDFKILTWNAAAEVMFGWQLGEVQGRNIGDIVPGLAAHTNGFLVEQPSQTKIERLETNFTRRDGSTIAISTTVSSLLNAAGVPTGWSITCSDITERKKQEEFRRLVMRELSHRVKNLLAVIMAMFRNSAESKESFEEFEEDFSARIRGLARSHDLLVQSEWKGASLSRLVDVQLQPFLGKSTRLQKSGPDVYLSPSAVQCMGLALHELATNAAKYGALSSPRGRILVETFRSEDHVDVSWTEVDGLSVTEPARSGFGRAVVEEMFADTTGGRARLEFQCDGVQWTARIPNSLIAA
jgi:PAS domain S-box-containing protein